MEEMLAKDKRREEETVGRRQHAVLTSVLEIGRGRESHTAGQFQEWFAQVTGKSLSPRHLSEESWV